MFGKNAGVIESSSLLQQSWLKHVTIQKHGDDEPTSRLYLLFFLISCRLHSKTNKTLKTFRNAHFS